MIISKHNEKRMLCIIIIYIFTEYKILKQTNKVLQHEKFT